MNPRVRAAVAALAAAWFVAVNAAMPAAGRSAAGDLQAPGRLSETGLYAPGRPGVIDPANRPFAPQYPLWSDGAAKARWIYLPPGTAIDTSDAADWTFPVGTRFWKEFTSTAGRSRRVSSGARQPTAGFSPPISGPRRDAMLSWHPPKASRVLSRSLPERRHDIPGANDCRACHGAKRPGPLGFNALQLSTDRDPNAIHGELLAPGMITLATLASERRLSPARPELVSNPPRIHASSPRTRAVLGYFASNCGTCHNRSGEMTFDGPSLKHSDRDAMGTESPAICWDLPRPGRCRVCRRGRAGCSSVTAPEASAMLVRMRSRRPSTQMPPLGTALRDEAAIDAITKWIAADLVKR